jgi:glyoxylase-like metal-dependent hydrolase (beta-lactamase superfamily II)
MGSAGTPLAAQADTQEKSNMTEHNAIPTTLQNPPEVVVFYDEPTSTFSYIVKDPASRHCAIVDSVLNFDYPAGHISHEGADQIIAHVQRHDLLVDWILETHVHADHLTAAPYLQEHLGGKIGIGANIVTVQQTFGQIFEEGDEFQRDGSQFDTLLHDGQVFAIGELEALALHTPGHTPACMTYLVGDTAFVGDTLFMPDGGTARADFPGGDARILYRSIKRLLSLPPETRLFMCHDYRPNGREIAYETTVAEEIKSNIHVNASITEADFVAMRQQRDATLGMPTLILPSLQINMRAGHLPAAKPGGKVFLKLPINAFNA